MKKLLILLNITVVTLVLSSCATMFGNKDRTVRVQSVPSGAKVYLNGVRNENTPTQVALGNITTNSYIIRVEKPGYTIFEQPVKTSFQPVGLLNILFWPGFIIDAVTGDMMKITNPNITAVLDKKHT